jgi:large subunit ribosomal protein L30
MTIAVVRMRGTVKINYDIRDTLAMLRINRVNHCVLIKESPQYLGMLQKTKDYITWGTIDRETAARLIKARGRLVGGTPIDDAAVSAMGTFKSVEELAHAVADGKAEWGKVEGTVPVFRLHPPRKGHEGMKRSWQAGGALGNRGAEINALIGKML